LETQRPQIAKASLSKNSNTREITLSDFKQSHSNKNSKVLAQKRPVDKWNRIKDQEISTHSCSHLIFPKGTKNILAKRQPLQQTVPGKLDIQT
jgi:hypothetical protein